MTYKTDYYARMVASEDKDGKPRAVSPSNPLHVVNASPYDTLREDDLSLTSSPQSLPTPPAGAVAAQIFVQGGSARTRTSSATLSASRGLLWPDGAAYELTGDDITAFRAVIGDGNPELMIKWLG